MSADQHQGPRRLPARQGMAWALRGWQLFQAQPVRLILLGLVMQFIVSAVRLPGIGLFVVLLLPALTAGMLLAYQRVGQGIRPPLASLFEPLVPSRTLGRLVLLAVVLLVLGTLVIGMLVAKPLEALDPAVVQRLEGGDPRALVGVPPEQLTPLVMGLAIGMAVAGTLAYFAVPLVAFRGSGTGSSLWRGLRGLARNWLPFLVFALFVLATGFPVFMIALFLLGTAGGEGLVDGLALILAMLVVLAWQVYLFGCQWVAFDDVFPQAAAPPPAGEGQLVA